MPRKTNWTGSPEQIEQLCELRRQGYNRTEISCIMHVSPYKFMPILEEHGLGARFNCGRKKGYNDIRDGRVVAIEMLLRKIAAAPLSDELKQKLRDEILKEAPDYPY